MLSAESRPMTLPTGLTTLPEKAELYAREIYFREGWHACQKAFGDRALEVLRSRTFVVFKPDAVIARKIEPGLRALNELGFKCGAADTLKFDRISMRELWRYELNLATLQRMAAIDILLTACPSLLVTLEHVAEAGLAASDRLRKCKGPADASKREPSHLRSQLGAFSNMVNFVHCPDEPADVVRELSLLLGPEKMKSMLSSDIGTTKLDAAALTQRLYEEAPRRDPDPAACIERVAKQVKKVPCAATRERMLNALLEARKKGYCDWSIFLADATIHVFDTADIALIAGHFTVCNIDGVAPVLKSR